jgi:hypothetical protein
MSALVSPKGYTAFFVPRKLTKGQDEKGGEPPKITPYELPHSG